MKKKIIKRLVLISSCFFIFINVSAYAEEKSLNIDSNTISQILQQTPNTYLSELDIYNINIFGENKLEREEKLKELNEKENEELVNNLFQKPETEEDGNEVLDDGEQYNLFNDIKLHTPIQHTKQENHSIYIIVLGISVCCIITGYLTRLYYKKKSKGDNINFEY